MNLRFLILSSALLISCVVYAQPTFNPVERGNRQMGAQLMLAWTDMFYSETILDVNKDYSTYGLHGAFGYGWFIERGWMVGLQSNLGFYHDEFSSSSSGQKSTTKAFDIALVPVTRYYFSVDKKHRFKPFLLAGLPIVHTRVTTTNAGQGGSDLTENYTSLRGSFGLGAAYFGRAGSIDLNVSNMGFYLGISKYFQRRKKE